MGIGPRQRPWRGANPRGTEDPSAVEPDLTGPRWGNEAALRATGSRDVGGARKRGALTAYLWGNTLRAPWVANVPGSGRAPEIRPQCACGNRRADGTLVATYKQSGKLHDRAPLHRVAGCLWQVLDGGAIPSSSSACSLPVPPVTRPPPRADVRTRHPGRRGPEHRPWRAAVRLNGLHGSLESTRPSRQGSAAAQEGRRGLSGSGPSRCVLA
jgi:hypothetical protein